MKALKTNLPFHPNTSISFGDNNAEIRVSLRLPMTILNTISLISIKKTMTNTFPRLKSEVIVGKKGCFIVFITTAKPYKRDLVNTQNVLLKACMIICRTIKKHKLCYEIQQLELKF